MKLVKESWILAASVFLLSLAVVVGALSAAEGADEAKREPGPPRIQMAILLDTSGSMTGLINQARAQLWKVVNEFATAKRNGKAPTLEVALYEYGKSSLPRKDGYMRMIVPLTNDLDRVSEELFKLTTRGGSEYCGQVIDLSVRELEWSENPKDLKCIFIAGNEAFTQGPVDFREACKAATSKNITVSTIFCGDHQAGINTNWADGAKLADGSYMSINQDQAVPSVAAPQDNELAELNAKLNRTYVAYGRAEERKKAMDRQRAQDSNAEKLAPAAAASRVATKASRLYVNPTWDLVDAIEQGTVKLEDLKDDQLPEEVRKIKPEDRAAFLAEKAKERKQIQARIQQLSKARDAYVADKRKEMAAEAGPTLDSAIIEAIQPQAAARGFEFENR
jgi:hypothetical protein